jgi:hypothetical protein
MKSSLFPIALLACACGGSPAAAPAVDPEPNAPAATDAPAAEAPPATTAPEAVPSAEAPAALPPASGKPASTSKIGDKSLSSVDIATVKAALEKAGYGVVGLEEIVTCGETETLQLSVTKKGKPMGLFSLQRPAAKPDACKGTAAVKDAYEQWKPSAEGPKAKNALTFDEPAGVLLAINLMKDEPGAAKKLMDALVTK